MPKIPSLLFVIRKELFSLSATIWIVCIGFSYIFLTLFLLNYRFSLATLQSTYPLFTKLVIFFSLLGGIFTAFSPLDSFTVIITSLFVGINILFMVKTMYALGYSGKVHVSVGGATVLGIISTGCSSCGFSLLSILGLSTSLSFLPFHGLELHLFSLLFLLFSAFYMLRKLRDSKYCKR